MDTSFYNYFANWEEWKEYCDGVWKGTGLSMIPSVNIPYELQLPSYVHWKTESTGQIQLLTKRGRAKNEIRLVTVQQMGRDSTILGSKDAFWKGEIQAMTKDRFHLHLQNSQGDILFSGVVTKSFSLPFLLPIEKFFRFVLPPRTK